MTPRLAVFGPTAVGKSAFAVELALAVGGEIVNADAVQVYRGFDRGAAKPDMAERRGVAHHLLDVADPGMELSVATYQALAEGVVREIERRGAVPIVSGGSGLYLRAALGEWQAFGAPPDPALRSWAALADAKEVYLRARAADPTAAEALSPRDRPRLVRVIERAAAHRAAGAAPNPRPFLKIGLWRPRRELYRRIDERAEAIWPHLLRETARLSERGDAARLLVGRTLGYREAALRLAGEVGDDEGIRRLQTATRHFAKRQLTWWRREPDTIWLRPEAGVAQLLGCLELRD